MRSSSPGSSPGAPSSRSTARRRTSRAYFVHDDKRKRTFGVCALLSALV